MKQSRIIEACIVAAAVVIFGLLFKAGLDNFTNRDRKVTVKGLSEIEVPADQVTWSITTVETGNDLQQVYANSSAKIGKISKFLTDNGIASSDISVGTPIVTDNEADRWSADRIPYRFKIKTVLSVNSSEVDKVRGLISRQGELLQQSFTCKLTMLLIMSKLMRDRKTFPGNGQRVADQNEIAFTAGITDAGAL